MKWEANYSMGFFKQNTKFWNFTRSGCWSHFIQYTNISSGQRLAFSKDENLHILHLRHGKYEVSRPAVLL